MASCGLQQPVRPPAVVEAVCEDPLIATIPGKVSISELAQPVDVIPVAEPVDEAVQRLRFIGWERFPQGVVCPLCDTRVSSDTCVCVCVCVCAEE